MVLILISMFSLSLAICVGMIARKLISLRKLKLSLVESIDRELYMKLSGKAHEFGHVLNTRYYVPFRAFVRTLFFFVAHHVLHGGLIIGGKIKTRHIKWYNIVKGKGVIKQKGAVSFFLQDVAEHKRMLRTK